MNTAIYLRKSRAEELAESMEDTLKKHKETLLSFAKNNDLSITDIFEEVVSGENLYARTEMLRLLEYIELNKYEAVLCMDIDRLGRGAMSQQGIILETFKSSNTKIITPRKIYDLNNDMDEEYTEFQSFFARRELKTINRRLQQGLIKTIEDGGYIANAPYGYEKCRVNKLPTLQVIEEEANFVRMIFDLYVNQSCGGEVIARTINAMGAKPKRGDKFNRSTIMKIIRNNVYIGKVVWNQRTHVKKSTISENRIEVTCNPQEEWKITDGIHPAIIKEDLYAAAQNILNERYRPSSKTGVLANPLAGMIICENCGSKMQFRKLKKGSNTFDYLLCQNKGCIKSTQFHLVEKGLLKAIDDELERLSISKIVVDNDNIRKLEDALILVEKELTLLSTQKDKLHDLLEQGVYTIEVFVDRNKTIDEKFKKIHMAISKIKRQVENEKMKNTNDFFVKAQNVLNIYHNVDTTTQNKLLHSIIENVVYYKEPSWKANQFTLTIKFKY